MLITFTIVLIVVLFAIATVSIYLLNNTTIVHAIEISAILFMSVSIVITSILIASLAIQGEFVLFIY